MKKFGFGRKEDSDDGNRSALFGSRSKNKPTATPTSNPYAQPPPSSDPYSQPNSRPSGYGGMSKPGLDSKSSYTGTDHGKSPASSGFSPGQQGGQSGYGRDQYGGSPATGGSRHGSSGYGGLGRVDPNDPNAADSNRDALFGGARSRLQERQQTSSAPPSYRTAASEAGDPTEPGYGNTTGSYKPYVDRQLTAEEEEEEDIQAAKQDIRLMKQKDVASTRNALRAAEEAEQAGRDALERLGTQGERIHNTEKNLDLSSNQNRVAQEKAAELKRLNKSMFAMRVANPFTSAERQRRRDEAIIDRHQDERLQREETRLAAYRTEQRREQASKEIAKGGNPVGGRPQVNLAERSKYQFEQDSEDDEMENEIDANLDALYGAATRLNGLARATGREIDEQTPHVERVIGKSDRVDDQLHMNRARILCFAFEKRISNALDFPLVPLKPFMISHDIGFQPFITIALYEI
ncbi:Meiosis-specific subunit of the t-SNARE complex [Myotisia sp. PD_48]|nr:Meiosis-specific subunit of the t-SNARE complex [Myotisia sp. PD_48]